jgi:hypothetical protein
MLNWIGLLDIVPSDTIKERKMYDTPENVMQLLKSPTTTKPLIPNKLG